MGREAERNGCLQRSAWVHSTRAETNWRAGRALGLGAISGGIAGRATRARERERRQVRKRGRAAGDARDMRGDIDPRIVERANQRCAQVANIWRRCAGQEYTTAKTRLVLRARTRECAWRVAAGKVWARGGWAAGPVLGRARRHWRTTLGAHEKAGWVRPAGPVLEEGAEQLGGGLGLWRGGTGEGRSKEP